MGDRAMRVDFSPAFLKSSMSTVKVMVAEEDEDGDDNANSSTESSEPAPDFSTLVQLEAGGGTVCLPIGTMVEEVVQARIPDATVNLCSGGASGCIASMKANNCSMYVEDELQLRYRAIQDTTLELPG